MKKHSGNPNFDKLFNDIISNDLETFKNKALSHFNTEISKLDQIENEESLIFLLFVEIVRTIHILLI